MRDAVALPVGVFKSRLAGAQPHVQSESRRFLEQPSCAESVVWNALFQCKPPRGTVARIARRSNVSLHVSMQKRDFISPQAFRNEARRIRKWYRPGRKTTRRRRGIVRQQGAPVRIRGLRSVWNKKVALHYRRLMQPVPQEGLWGWRTVALPSGAPAWRSSLARFQWSGCWRL